MSNTVRNGPLPGPGALMLAVVMGTIAVLSCAPHPAKMSSIRGLMAQDEYEHALEEFEKTDTSEDDVLTLLERGLLLHYAGRYRESNDVFERAEVLSEDLYTKSISREAASLVTSDLALKYVPKPFEQVLINYFRALNYMFLGEKEEALVECRKASDKLALYSEQDSRPYRRDAFIEYLTGLLYEWDGEINDAFIAYRNARSGYDTYGEVFGIKEPPYLACDVARTGTELGFAADSSVVHARNACAADSAEAGSGDLAKIVVFMEQGFVPARQEWSVNIPILKAETGEAKERPYEFSVGAYSRAYGHSFDAGDIAYFLRVALPRYPSEVPRGPLPALFVDGVAIAPSLVEDIFAVARAELDHDMPKIFAKTLARAIIKYKATDEAGDKWGRLVGGLVNVAVAATEQADLRGWLSLPRAVYVAVLYVKPGEHVITLGAPAPYEDDGAGVARAATAGGPEAGSNNDAAPEAETGGSGHLTSSAREVEIDGGPGSTNFVRFRTY